MRSKPTIVSSADLLRALVMAKDDPAKADRLAKMLDFYPKAETETVNDVLVVAQEPKIQLSAESVQVQQQGTRKAALQCSFLTVTACETLEQAAQKQALPSADKPLTPQDCQPLNPGNPPQLPLVRKQRLWPAVKRSLTINRPKGVDLARLMARISQAEPVYCLPRLALSWWDDELVVLWDCSERMAPYQQDYRSLLDQVLASRGSIGLKIYQVDGLPGQVTGFWPAQASYSGCLTLPVVARNASILILSDLGALSTWPFAAKHWQSFARDARKAGAQIVAWVPHSARQVEKATAQQINIYCLDRQGNLRRQAGRLQTVQQRQAEHQRLHELREQLLTRLAFCVRLETALLRAGRELTLATAAEPGLEGLTWSYRPIVRASHSSRPLATAYQAHYRNRFSALTIAEQQAALKCVWHWHSWQGRSTGVLETLIWESHAGTANDGKVKQLVAYAQTWISAFRTSQKHKAGSEEMIAFAQDVLARNWQDETFQRHNSAWLAELWCVSGQTEVPPGLDQADVVKVSSAETSEAPQAYRLMQIGADLILWPMALLAPPFAVSTLNSTWLLSGLELNTGSQLKRYWLTPKGKPTLLAGADESCCALHINGKRYELTQLHRPTWASKFGRDPLGIFAELLLTTDKGTAKQTLRWIEPGQFLMGSPGSEPERRDNEGPQHEVTLSQGFWLADTACTQALWQAVMDKNPSHFKGDAQLPVEQVSWHDVQVFLQRLQALLPDCQADLPSEAEWEYACRAGTQTPFSFGTNINAQQVNYEFNLGKTVAVKSLPANQWGLYEMHGNVDEWCKDGQRDYDSQSQLDPVGSPADGKPRVIRGGSWDSGAGGVRSALRYAFLPGIAGSYLGFRFCLRSIQPGQEEPAGAQDSASGRAWTRDPAGSKAEDGGLPGKLSSFNKKPKSKQ